MDIKAIQKMYTKGEYDFHPLEDTSMFPDNHVFDGDKSVNWNKAEVASENTRRMNRKKEIRRKNDELTEKMHSDVVNYIAEAFGMSVKQATLVESYVWEEKHSCMIDYFDAIDDIADMIRRIITAK